MPYADHLRMTVGGTIGTNSPAPEIWSCTINSDFATMADVDEAFVHGFYDQWAAFILDPDAHFSTATKLTYAKCGVVDNTGHQPGVVFRWDEVTQGGSDGIVHPFQDSLVVTLRSAVRGAKARGRFYLPPQSIDVSAADGEIADADRDDVATAVGAFLSTLNTSLGGDGPDDVKLVVASSTGVNFEVTGYQVGRVLDTQRRRRNHLNEDKGPILPLA